MGVRLRVTEFGLASGLALCRAMRLWEDIFLKKQSFRVWVWVCVCACVCLMGIKGPELRRDHWSMLRVPCSHVPVKGAVIGPGEKSDGGFFGNFVELAYINIFENHIWGASQPANQPANQSRRRPDIPQHSFPPTFLPFSPLTTATLISTHYLSGFNKPRETCCRITST